MKLETAIALNACTQKAMKAYGTSEGVTKAWDTRGRASAVAKSLKLPGGKLAKATDNSYSWHKRGGYADEQMKQIHEAALAHGFAERATGGASPGTGNYVGHGHEYEHPSGWKLSTYSNFGPTKDTNDHYVNLSRGNE